MTSKPVVGRESNQDTQQSHLEGEQKKSTQAFLSLEAIILGQSASKP